jgi:hypothetical protein
VRTLGSEGIAVIEQASAYPRGEPGRITGRAVLDTGGTDALASDHDDIVI